MNTEAMLKDPKGVETPYKDNGLSAFKKRKRIEAYFKKIMETLGLDLSDDSLAETPKRVAKMYVDEVFSGLDPKNFPKITTIDNKFNYKEPLIELNITLNSNCEHHFIPIIGVCHIAYVPKDKVIGLSKLNRLVHYYAKRPQVQERLNLQIAGKLKELLETEDVAVVIDAVHTCVRTRGIQDVSSLTRTMTLSGRFDGSQTVGELPSLRDQFLHSIPKSIEFKL
jgi:GTP cyclohydrolase I